MRLKESEIIERLQKMDEYDFEHFVAELWERRGWDTEVSAKSGDRGVDVIATRSVPYSEKEVIQAKRYHASNRIHSDELQQYLGLGLQEENADKVIVVCTSSFTDNALSVANDTNVKCVDGHSLADIIIRQDAQDLVEKYTTPGTGRSTTDNVPSESTTKTNRGRSEGNQRKFTIVEHGTDIDVEILGLKRVETELASDGFLGEPTSIDGVIAAFKIFSKGTEIGVSTDSPREFIFRDKAGNEYYPASLGSGVFKGNWNTYSFERTRIEPGGSAKVAMAVSLPGNTKVSEIAVEKGGFLSTNEELLIELDFEKRERLNQLPDEIESAL